MAGSLNWHDWKKKPSHRLTTSALGCYKKSLVFSTRGAVAQLGARLDGIEEVEGSNPFGSTSS